MWETRGPDAFVVSSWWVGVVLRALSANEARERPERSGHLAPRSAARYVDASLGYVWEFIDRVPPLRGGRFMGECGTSEPFACIISRIGSSTHRREMQSLNLIKC